MKTIPLANTQLVALVDDEDYAIAVQHKWHLGYASNKNTKYAICSTKIDGKWKTIRLHRLIMGVEDPKLMVDHEDHDGLNCQKHNMRIANATQNGANRRSYGKSKYLGVHQYSYSATFKNGNTKTYSYWRARIKHGGEYVSLGLFKTEESAAMAYDTAAKQYHKEFANLNFKHEAFDKGLIIDAKTITP